MNQSLYPRLTLTREIEDYEVKSAREQYDGTCAVCGTAFTGREEKKYCSDYCKNSASYQRNKKEIMN